MTYIKICGINEEVHALTAAEAGADFIGLVFAPSPRQVSVRQARKIVSALRKSNNTVKVVGVFVNMPVLEVNKIINFCGLDWGQLSGDESWEYCRQITKPIIKVIKIRLGQRLSPEDILAKLSAEAQALFPQRFIFLLDSEVSGKYGGTGTTFDWELAQLAVKKFPIIIAGGLTPFNVGEIIEKIAPWGVDVSSGVEVSGNKDISKIRAFIEAVRRADEKQKQRIA